MGFSNILDPVWINEGENNIETISATVNIGPKVVRFCVAYGLQESMKNEDKINFWEYLSNDIKEAKEEGQEYCLQMDANSWLGEDIIKGDPRKQNYNGKLFLKFLDENPWVHLANILPIFNGLITRSRKKLNKVETSIIDFLVISEGLKEAIKVMLIDEEKEYAITSVGKTFTDSDHYVIYAKFGLRLPNMLKTHIKVTHYKDAIAIAKFKGETSKSDAFSDCFKNELSFDSQVTRWKKKH